MGHQENAASAAASVIVSDVNTNALIEVVRQTAAKHKDKLAALLSSSDALFDEGAIRREMTALLSNQRHKMIMQMLGVDNRYEGEFSLKSDSPLFHAFKQAADSIITPMVQAELDKYSDPTTKEGLRLRRAIAKAVKVNSERATETLHYYVGDEIKHLVKNIALTTRKQLSDELTKELAVALAQAMGYGETVPQEAKNDS